MATAGPFFPGTVATASVAPENANDWTNPTNIQSDNGTEAQITAATYDANDISFQLQATNFNFGSVIPAGATIDGITVKIDRRVIAATAVDNRVQLFDAGAPVGNNKASATAWPGTSTVATYGSATDKWGITPTAPQVNGSGFGVVLSVKATGANTDIGVDYISMTVDYTPPVGSTGTGSLSKTLSASASGSATQKFTGSGAPSKSLSDSASGTATQTFTGSGSPGTALSASASGDAVNTPPAGPQPVTGSGAPSTSLDADGSGTATETFTGSGSPSSSLDAAASGSGAEQFTGSGSPAASLDATASGSGTETIHITGTGALARRLSASISGTATNPNSAVRRRARGRVIFHNTPEPHAPTHPWEEPRWEVVEAEPLPELPEPLPELGEAPQLNLRGITPPVARTAPDVPDDDEDLLDLLLFL